MNMMKTAMLIAFMTALFMGIGLLLGGKGGMMIALVIALGMNLWSYWNADKMVLRMNNAQEVDARTAPEFYHLVERLAANAGLPMPRVYLIDEDQPNAFATGRNPRNAAVAATTGLLRRLTQDEVAGVMAHELAHVENRDTLIMTITATLAGAISMLGNFALFSGSSDNRNNPLGMIGVLLAMIVAPFAAMLVQMAISRTREYAADRRGAEISGAPMSLASALAKIASNHSVNEPAERNPAMAHMFIINPLSGQRMDSLFSTHPDTSNRIAALQAMTDIAGGHAGLGGSVPRRDAVADDGAPGPWSRGADRRQGSRTPGRNAPPSAGPRKGPWG